MLGELNYQQGSIGTIKKLMQQKNGKIQNVFG